MATFISRISSELHFVVNIDDSGSMRHPASKELSRWEAQAKLVQRIAQIGTRILPKGEGVALEFINHTLNNGFRMSAEETKNYISGITPAKGAGTNIGTNLRAKILEPLVYQKIERSSPKEMLERPLLVSVITDGQPAPEAENVLVDTIIECRQKLEMAGYPIESTLHSTTTTSRIRRRIPPRANCRHINIL